MTTKATHLHRPSDQSAAIAAAKSDKRDASYRKTLLPALVQERQREYQARLKRAMAPASKGPLCNTNTPGTYRTGDGETVQQPRPGSLHAFTLPSRGIGT